MQKLIYGIVIFSLFHQITYAQETSCNDGIDNDGNGLIDCFDLSCLDSCDNTFYYGLDTPSCIFIPTVSPNFQLEEVYKTPDNINMDSRQNPIIGDVDGDGIPEIIAKDKESIHEIFVFDGTNGSLKYTIPAPSTDVFFNSVCIADVNNNGYAEIFVVAENNSSLNGIHARKLFGFTFNSSTSTYDTLFISTEDVGYTGNADRSSPSIIDFDQDGTPEIYVGNKIWSALTGDFYGGGGSTNSMGENASGEEYFPVAFDAIPESPLCPTCDGLELIAGNQVYAINFNSGSSPINWTITPYITASSGLNDGYTSLSDYDKDGDIDAIVVSNGTVYVWDIQTSNQIGSTFTIPDNHAVSTNCTRTPMATTTGGRANVADFDGDGDLEIGVAGRNVYSVIDNDMTELWSISACDQSQKTGSTVFDFEGDGIFEVVYRDEIELYILDGTDGTIKSQLSCVSSTRTDYPLVVDVNGDGQAEICAACGGSNGNITVFNSPNQSWVSSRRVWNQHGFFNTNINDDLSVPRYTQKHNIVSDSVILNNFLMQATYLKMDGQPAFSAPDDSIAINSYDISECQNLDGQNTDTIIANITIFNTSKGSWKLPANTKISLYNGDPFSDPTATYLTTVSSDSTLEVGESETMDIFFDDPEVALQLHIVVNDNGTGTIPFSEPTTNIGECDYSNNVKDIEIAECLLNLPIVLSSFEVEQRENRVLLEWITESETNNDYFEIQKSIDGINFNTIANQKGQGTTTIQTYYHTYDSSPYQNGISYYRLKQVDFDGKFSYSNIKSVQFNSAQFKEDMVSIFPNPTQGFLKIECHYEFNEIFIYNLQGELVKTLSHQIQFGYYDINSLANGVYFVDIPNKNNTLSRKVKLIVTK